MCLYLFTEKREKKVISSICTTQILFVFYEFFSCKSKKPINFTLFFLSFINQICLNSLHIYTNSITKINSTISFQIFEENLSSNPQKGRITKLKQQTVYRQKKVGESQNETNNFFHCHYIFSHHIHNLEIFLRTITN